MRQFFIIYLFLLVLALTVLGFRGCKSTKPPLEVFPDMDRQARFHEQGGTSFFADGRMDRLPVPGTVPAVGDDRVCQLPCPEHRFLRRRMHSHRLFVGGGGHPHARIRQDLPHHLGLALRQLQ